MTCKGNSAIIFFKIITISSIEAGKLKLPNGFTRKYSGDMSNRVFLKLPDNTSWEIHWSKHDSDIWFEKGWQEFTSYYSLDHGHLVLFEYNNTSHFRVHIFDKSTLEIEYPSHGNEDEHNKPDYQIGDDSVEILDEIPLSKKNKQKSPFQCPKPHKKLRTRRSEDVGRITKLQNIAKQVQNEGNDTQGQSEGVNCETISPQHLTNAALEEANEFPSKNPFFIINLKPDMNQRYRPTVPMSFIKKYLTHKQTIMLQFEKKLWPVKFIFYPNHGGKLSRGWLPFTEQSKLVGGDVCVFELINKKDLVLDVHIYRGH